MFTIWMVIKWMNKKNHLAVMIVVVGVEDFLPLGDNLNQQQ